VPRAVARPADRSSYRVDAMRVAAVFAVALCLLALTRPALAAGATPGNRPNVLVIMTDDQGFGDFAMNGNPVVRTPNLDKLAKDGVRLTNFYVSPVCSPTRASLLTGRYNYRTGVVDTYLGRSLMDSDEVTLAEMLRWAGYRTGIFGKWHLGDNYPMRPQDQGFGESLVLKGGGLGQPSDFPGGSNYTDPILLRNGRPVKTTGYVSDVLATATMNFMTANRDRPFFAYLAFNAPHEPLNDVPKDQLDRYKSLRLTASQFVSPGWPLPQRMDMDKARSLSDAELDDALREAKQDLWGARFALSTRQLKDYSTIPQTRRTIARILTVQRERKLGRTA